MSAWAGVRSDAAVEFGALDLRRSSRPWRTSIARTAASSSSSASIIGRRKPPTLWPSMFSAAFVQVGLAVMNSVS